MVQYTRNILKVLKQCTDEDIAHGMTWYAGNDSTDHYIDLGAGDDEIYTTIDANELNFSKLDGGPGRDTIKFSGSNSITLTLTTAGATNFENIQGGGGDDTINGDDNANTLTGSNGADIIFGHGGNDILGGQSASVADGDYDEDILNGGPGNDIIYGTAGANMIDGGPGQDNMSGGNGNDTFIIRIGDGGSELKDADIIIDFQDQKDVFGLSDGLNFDELSVSQGIGSNSSHTIIRHTSSGEYLTIVKDISASNLNILDFSSIE